jgi:hypothetical protein
MEQFKAGIWPQNKAFYGLYDIACINLANKKPPKWLYIGHTMGKLVGTRNRKFGSGNLQYIV